MSRPTRAVARTNLRTRASWRLPKNAVREAALLFGLCGAVSLANDFLPHSPGYGRLSSVVLSAAALTAGLLVFVLGQTTLLQGPGAFLMPLGGLAMVGINYAFGLIPAVMLGAWFLLIAVYVGLWLPQGTVFLLSLLAALAYVLPLFYGAPRNQFDVISMFIAIPVSVVAGEIVAASATALRSAERSQRELSLKLEGARAELDRRERYYRALVERVNDYLLVLETDGSPRYASPALLGMLGHSLEDLHGEANRRSFVHPDDAETLDAAIERALASPGEPVRCELRLHDASDRYHHCIGITTSLLDDAAVEGIVLVMHDISESKELEEQLREQALHDPLTGLANRVLIEDRLEQMVARSKRAHTSMAVLYVDLDRFKNINDSLGHKAGDQLLKLTAERLVAALRKGDTVGRLGGDEFVILSEDSTMPVEPELLAERVLSLLAEPFSLDGERPVSLTMSASVGVAQGVALPANELMRNADVALYQAKAGGKNCYVVFRPEMYAALEERLALEADLHGALSRDEFVLVYQPIVDLETLQVTSTEALLRWQHPARGLLTPDKFLPLLEDSVLIIDVGAWVLRTACAQAAAWVEKGLDLSISVNVSPRQLQHDLLRVVSSTLEATGLEPSRLVLEVTESVLLHNTDATIRELHDFHRLGVRIAIDDFGTGYSSMSYLRQFPIDILKIDRSFIAGLDQSREASTIVRSLVGLGRNLGLQTVAEGIEETSQLSALREDSCTNGQGFLIARPVPPRELERLVRDGVELHPESAAV